METEASTHAGQPGHPSGPPDDRQCSGGAAGPKHYQRRAPSRRPICRTPLDVPHLSGLHLAAQPPTAVNTSETAAPTRERPLRKLSQGAKWPYCWFITGGVVAGLQASQLCSAAHACQPLRRRQCLCRMTFTGGFRRAPCSRTVGRQGWCPRLAGPDRLHMRPHLCSCEGLKSNQGAKTGPSRPM